MVGWMSKAMDRPCSEVRGHAVPIELMERRQVAKPAPVKRLWPLKGNQFYRGGLVYRAVGAAGEGVEG
jgi:hypothetical protein